MMAAQNPAARVERWYSAAALAGLPGMPTSVRRVRSRAERESWPSRPRAKGKGREYALDALPRKTQAALILRDTPIVRAPSRPKIWTDARLKAAWQHYDRCPERTKSVARRRLAALHALDALTSGGVPLIEARATVAAQMQRENVPAASPASIARWQKAVAGAARSDWLALLVPHHAGGSSRRTIEAAAWDTFLADYLRVEQPSATSCYERLQRVAAQRPEWAPLPSLKTFLRRIERDLPRAVRVLAREGEEALDRTYPAQERDRTGFAALEAVNADGHRFDFWAKFPDGSIGRPSLLGWQDLYSGKLLAWRLCDHESSDVVRLSLADLVRTYGIPQHAWLDNGRAFSSKWMTGGARTRYRFKVRDEDPVGLITSLGIETHWVTPYHGQAKPIERAWRDLCDRIAKHPAFAGAYTGNNPLAKPENYRSRAIEWHEVERIVGEEIRAHNAREGRTAATCAGRSFDATFTESYASTPIRKVTDHQLHALLLQSDAVTASATDGSVHLAGNRYWCEALAEFAKRKVVLRVDPANLHAGAHVYSLDGSYIADAPCVARVGFADTAAAREHARGKKQYRRAAKQMLAAERRMDAAAVAAQLPPPPPEEIPDTSVIAPVFGAPVFRHHGEAPPLASTGTDDEAARDMRLGDFMARRLDRLQEDQI